MILHLPPACLPPVSQYTLWMFCPHGFTFVSHLSPLVLCPHDFTLISHLSSLVLPAWFTCVSHLSPLVLCPHSGCSALTISHAPLVSTCLPPHSECSERFGEHARACLLLVFQVSHYTCLHDFSLPLVSACLPLHPFERFRPHAFTLFSSCLPLHSRFSACMISGFLAFFRLVSFVSHYTLDDVNALVRAISRSSSTLCILCPHDFRLASHWLLFCA